MASVLAGALLISACAGARAHDAQGYSGLAPLDKTTFLAVHDRKAFEDGARLGLIHIRKDTHPRYEALKINDWKEPDGKSNDLESACAIPGRSGEFLVAESGTWEGKYGRIFHISVKGAKARVLKPYPLPNLLDNSDSQDGDQYEGLACWPQGGGKFLVVLGERGGSRHYPDGVLRWGIFDPKTNRLDWKNPERSDLFVTAPGAWIDPARKRDISALHIDDDGILWASATGDAGDDGPFRSVIYAAAVVGDNPKRPITIIRNPSAAWTVDGLKVEGLSAPPPKLDDTTLSIATEDENLGGVWRPLYPTTKRD